MLSQVEFPISASTTPQHGNSGYLSQQPSYFAGTDAAARPPSTGVLAENKWFQTATGMPQASVPPNLPPPLQDTSSFATVPPPGFDFTSQLHGGLGQTLLGSQAENGFSSRLEMDSRFVGDHQDRREEYIRQLEAENRYLRTCLIQFLGPNAAALSLLPPLPGGPQQSPFASDSSVGLPLPCGPCPPPPGDLAPKSGSSSLLPMTSASQGLSPSAPPFWPAWQDPSDGVPPHQPSGLEQVSASLRQDAEGHVASR